MTEDDAESTAVKEATIIEAESKKDVAAIEAIQASNAEDASAFMTTLDKLQEFKRYTLALIFLGILGIAMFLFAFFTLLVAYRGDYAVASENFKWLITLISGTVGVIIGFYFAANRETNTG